MAYTTLGSVTWGSGPPIPVTFYYDYLRSGTAMQYKIKIVIGAVTGASYFGYPIYATISLDGSAKVSGYTLKSASPSQWSTAITYESDWLTVSNKTTGTTSLSVRLYSGSGATRDKTYTYSLAVSPAATTPTLSASTVAMGGTVTINTPRAVSSYTHDLYYKIGSGSWVWIAGSVGTSYTWTVPLSLASNVPAGTSLAVTIWCRTYSGSTQLGDRSVSLTATVPASVVPTISAVSIAEATTGIAAKFEAYVQSKSTLAVAITAAGAYGSTIAKYETTIQGVKYTGASFTSSALAASGSSTITVTVTDSRGRTATHTAALTVVAYVPPVINSMTSWRIDTAGTDSEDGPRIAVAMDFEIAEVGAKNDRTFALQYRRSDESSFTTFSSGTASWAYSGTQLFTSSPVVSPDYAYTIRLTIADYFGSATRDFEVPTGFTVIDFRSTGKGIAFGKVSEKDKMEINMDIEVKGEALADFIVEQGTSGIWTYRKWSSGIAECWGDYTAASVNISKNNYSGFYYSDPISVELPFTFAAAPTCVTDGGASSFISFSRRTNPTTTRVSFWVCCHTSGATSVSISVGIHVNGKWK